jgi:hypothetical protein
MTTSADPGAIDLEQIQRWRSPDREIDALIAAVEALRERVAKLEQCIKDDSVLYIERTKALRARVVELARQERAQYQLRMQAKTNVEAAEAREAALAGACCIVLAELPEDDEGIEIGDLQRLLCACRTALAATPAEALERAKAVESKGYPDRSHFEAGGTNEHDG